MTTSWTPAETQVFIDFPTVETADEPTWSDSWMTADDRRAWRA